MNNITDIKGGLARASWSGYLRADGRLGIRNKVLVIYTVECASHVARRIAEELNIDDVDVIGFYGCCDNEYAVGDRAACEAGAIDMMCTIGVELTRIA